VTQLPICVHHALGQDVGDRSDTGPDRALARVAEAEHQLGKRGPTIRPELAHPVEPDITLPRCADDRLLVCTGRQVRDRVEPGINVDGGTSPW